MFDLLAIDVTAISNLFTAKTIQNQNHALPTDLLTFIQLLGKWRVSSGQTSLVFQLGYTYLSAYQPT